MVIIGLCVLNGLYRGFFQTMLNLGCGLVSLPLSFWLFPKLSDLVSTNTEITRFISSFTDSTSLLGDLDLSRLNVEGLASETVASIVEKANLPKPLDMLLSHNLSSQVFAPYGDLASNVGDYVNQTLISVCISVVCFLLCYALVFLVLRILNNLIKAVFRYPVLKHFDALCGGVFGILCGVMLCYVLFTVLPLLESVIPLESFRTAVAESRLSSVFGNGNLIIAIMNRKL